MTAPETNDTDNKDCPVWFAYDGDCPFCSTAARALRIRKAAGGLRLVNARDEPDHPFIQEISQEGMNLDTGMVLKYGGTNYHGADALHMMALLGSKRGWFNRITVLIFRSKTLARVAYPVLRGVRNLMLRLIGVKKIGNLRAVGHDPIFQPIFGLDWARLPPVIRAHYAVRPYSRDRVVVSGRLDVKISRFMAAMSRLSGMLVSRSGRNVPVTVTFTSGDNSADFHFERVFHFPEGVQVFRSRMALIGGNELVEYMRFGIGWKMGFAWDGGKVTLSHRGYVWRIFGLVVPIPLGLILGAGTAEETPLSDDEFHMWTHAAHPWFGKLFAYSGKFRVTEVSCPERS